MNVVHIKTKDIELGIKQNIKCPKCEKGNLLPIIRQEIGVPSDIAEGVVLTQLIWICTYCKNRLW